MTPRAVARQGQAIMTITTHDGAAAHGAQLQPQAWATGAAAGDRRVRLFGIDVTDTRRERAAAWLVERARSQQPASVAFLNAHCANVACRDAGYRESLGRMDRIFADGVGVRIAARAAGVALQDNVNGTDLFPELCRQAAEAGIGLYLLGAREGVAAAAARNMVERTPGLVVSGTHHGYISDPDHEAGVIAAINASGAGIVLVAMGVPAQEVWIARNRHRLTAPVVIGVGGLYDYYSGRIPRAPLALRTAGLEWAWRLAQEPRRLARRYLLGNVEFLARLAWLRLTAPAAFRQGLAA